MSTIKEDAGVYANCIKEIKTRLAVVKKPHSKDFLDGLFYMEFMCLQIRKICELFAFSTLTANRQEYEKLRNEFEKDWNFSRIIKSVSKVNEKYFPEPLKPITYNSTTQDDLSTVDDSGSERLSNLSIKCLIEEENPIPFIPYDKLFLSENTCLLMNFTYNLRIIYSIIIVQE